MTTEGRAINEARIRERLDDWAKAVRAKDIERVISHYAPDILLSDLAPPLQYRGADSCRKNWAEWFSTFQGQVGYEIRATSITSGDDLAFCHSLNRIQGIGRTGSKPMSGCARPLAFVRWTVGGRSRMSTIRCLSTWSPPTMRRSTSSLSGENLRAQPRLRGVFTMTTSAIERTEIVSQDK